MTYNILLTGFTQKNTKISIIFKTMYLLLFLTYPMTNLIKLKNSNIHTHFTKLCELHTTASQCSSKKFRVLK